MSNTANTFVHRIKISPPSRKKREAGIRRGYLVPSNLVFFIWRNFSLVHIIENCPFILIEPLCHFQDELKVIQYMYGGEPMVHTHTETLGDIIKKARQKSGITMEELAFRLDVTPRYLYRIENEGKKPSFDVLYSLIRELSISSDLIFYPERLSTDSEIENLIRRLYSLDERSLDVIKATANALLETAITSEKPKK